MKPSKSILSQSYINSLMKLTRENLKRDGYLGYVLVVNVADGQVITIELTDTMTVQPARRKQARMSTLGMGIRQAHYHIREAVLVMPGRDMVATEPRSRKRTPDKPPTSQQTICITGRNDRNTRHTVVVQPFSLDRGNQPVWKDPLITDYNVSAVNNPKLLRLLDCLFEESPVQTSQ